MKKQDQVSSLVLLIIGLLITIISLSSLTVGTSRNPGPGLFPVVTGMLLALFSVCILISSKASQTSEKKMLRSLWAGLSWNKTVHLVIAFLVYALILETAGFILSTTSLLVFLFRIMEPRKWKVVVALSVFAAVGSFLIFSRVLQVQLPVGLFGI